MSLETQVADELRTVATGLTTPPPPSVPALTDAADRATARSRRSRMTVVVAAAAAAVALVLVVQRTDWNDGTPEPAPAVPDYYAPGVPYVVDDTLYIGHEAQAGTWSRAESVGRGTAARRVVQATEFDRVTEVVLFLDGRQVVVLRETLEGPVLSPDGTVASWMEGRPGRTTLRSFDLATGRELGSAPVTLPAPDADGERFVQIDAVRNDGTTWFLSDVARRVWTPGSAPRPAEPGTYPEGGLPRPAGFPADANVRLSLDHLWGAWASDLQGEPVTQEESDAEAGLSPLAPAVSVQKPGDESSRMVLVLPADSRPSFLVWSSPTVFDVVDGRHPVEIARCDIVKRRCEDTWMG